jgi:hypothetical protein
MPITATIYAAATHETIVSNSPGVSSVHIPFRLLMLGNPWIGPYRENSQTLSAARTSKQVPNRKTWKPTIDQMIA